MEYYSALKRKPEHAVTRMCLQVLVLGETGQLQEARSCVLAHVRHREEPGSQRQKVDGGCQGWGTRGGVSV